MLAEAIVKVGGYAGVVLIVLFGNIEVPHITTVSGASLASLGTSSQGPSVSREFQEGLCPS